MPRESPDQTSVDSHSDSVTWGNKMFSQKLTRHHLGNMPLGWVKSIVRGGEGERCGGFPCGTNVGLW